MTSEQPAATEILLLRTVSRFLCGEKLPKKAVLRGWHPLCSLRHSMRNTAKKILIVDSNDRFRESLRTFIQGLGHQVVEATTGPDALDVVSNIHPDLVIMDVRLPGMNGDEVTTRIKRNIATRNIPVIINSGWTTACNVEERIHRALLAGAAEILYRPFQLPMLRDILRTYLFA